MPLVPECCLRFILNLNGCLRLHCLPVVFDWLSQLGWTAVDSDCCLILILGIREMEGWELAGK
jgi:hypothetical protein